jgi:hypothetical protein
MCKLVMGLTNDHDTSADVSDLLLWKGIVVMISPAGKIPTHCRKFGHDRFLSRSFLCMSLI